MRNCTVLPGESAFRMELVFSWEEVTLVTFMCGPYSEPEVGAHLWAWKCLVPPGTSAGVAVCTWPLPSPDLCQEQDLEEG